MSAVALGAGLVGLNFVAPSVSRSAARPGGVLLGVRSCCFFFFFFRKI